MPEFTQSLRLDLPHPFTGDIELATHFLKRPARPIQYAKTQFQNLPLSFIKGFQDSVDFFLQHRVQRGIGRRDRLFIFDKITKIRVPLITDRRL
jgi:hypothetical protein